MDIACLLTDISLLSWQILNFFYLVFVYFVYPETKGLTLEEVAKVFDGKDAKVGRVDVEQMKKETLKEKDDLIVSVKED